jgi:hypothetical protein
MSVMVGSSTASFLEGASSSESSDHGASPNSLGVATEGPKGQDGSDCARLVPETDDENLEGNDGL